MFYLSFDISTDFSSIFSISFHNVEMSNDMENMEERQGE
jgi:hypothetical protein